MAMILENGASAQKAATGPNPQNRPQSNTAQVKKNSGGLPTSQIPTNQAVGSPGATPSAPVAAQPPPPAAAPASYDYSTDPVLQQIKAQQEFAISNAQADALAQKKVALIQYGDANLALAVTGDKLTADAAANNPGSTLAQLAAKQTTDNRATNEAENKSNLFYSSDAGYQLGLNQQAYLQARGQAAGNIQGQLGSIGTNLLAAQQAAYDKESQASSDAYARALQNPALGHTSTPASSAPAVVTPTSKAPTASQSLLTPLQSAAAAKVGLTPKAVTQMDAASVAKMGRLG